MLKEEKQHAQYICPMCENFEITYYETKHDDKYFYNRGYCDFCGATFNEMYKLAYINMVDIVEYG